MNACKKNYLHTRNMAYQCDNYSHYTLVGEEYSEQVQIIQINFTYEMDRNDRKIVRKYYIQDEEKKKFVKNFVILEYNMDRIMEFWYAKDEKGIEKYKYLIMLDLGIEDLNQLSKKDRLVEKYKMDVEIINRDPRFRVYMTEEEDKRKIYNTEISLARKEGLQQGEHKKAIETAKSLLSMKVLSLEKIEKLYDSEN